MVKVSEARWVPFSDLARELQGHASRSSLYGSGAGSDCAMQEIGRCFLPLARSREGNRRPQTRLMAGRVAELLQCCDFTGFGGLNYSSSVG